jgi:hypothetical protein
MTAKTIATTNEEKTDAKGKGATDRLPDCVRILPIRNRRIWKIRVLNHVMGRTAEKSSLQEKKETVVVNTLSTTITTRFQLNRTAIADIPYSNHPLLTHPNDSNRHIKTSNSLRPIKPETSSTVPFPA